jgi:hypothetical protein
MAARLDLLTKHIGTVRKELLCLNQKLKIQFKKKLIMFSFALWIGQIL